MANSATAQSPVKVWLEKAERFAQVIPILVVLDTVDEDLTIFDPDADKAAFIVGMQYSEADAHSLSVKYASTTYNTFQMPANSGISKDIDGGAMYAGPAGADLKMRVATAGIATMLVYVLHAESLAV